MKPSVALLMVLTAVGCSHANPRGTRTSNLCVRDGIDTTTFGPTRFLPEFLAAQDHFALSVSPNLQTLFVTRGLIDGGGVYELSLRDGKWTAPRPVPTLQGEFNEVDLFVSPDGMTGLFMSKRPLNAGGSTLPEQDLWMMHREDGSWSVPIHLGNNVNSPARDGYPTVTADGTLYFFSERPGGQGSSDVYRARPHGESYGTAENLGSMVNSDAWDGLPYIAPDESFLIFFSTRPGGYGDGDLWVSYNVAGEWSYPENLGALVNSPLSDLTPHVGPKGECLFFSRPSGPDNRRVLYVIPISQTPLRIDRTSFTRALMHGRRETGDGRREMRDEME